MADDPGETPPASPHLWPSPRQWALLGVLFLAAVVCERAMGRPWTCACGQLLVFAADTASRHNSQHLLDPYSLTHVLHGVLLCGALWLLLRRRLDPAARFVLAVSLELGWEVLENTSWVIDKYRADTISLDYYGDSVLNSMADVGACALGYLLARRLPLWGSALLFLAVEVTLLLWIRDSLLLNVIMLICPLDAVRAWQAGG